MKINSLLSSTLVLSLTAATLFMASTSLGAEKEGGESHATAGFGIHGGLNFSDYDYSNNSISQSKNNSTGPLFGIHLEGMPVGLFGLRVEANYSVKGYALNQFATVTHRYLQIPLLFKISPISGPIELFVEGGPAASLHLSSSTEVANTSINYNDNSNDWDFSLIAGVGIGYKIETTILEFEGRYDYGLKNLNDSNSVEVKSRAIQLIAGVTFLN